MDFTVRTATQDDYEFTFSLKKLAEVDAITAIFGWDEELQRELHLIEWHQGLPELIYVDGEPVGSYMLVENNEIWHFSRFFLLPNFHGKGIGSKILQQVSDTLDSYQQPCKLCYLQGSRVQTLYPRFGFVKCSEDDQFVYMIRYPTK
ncbi:GNAT family N-acetyltransferase [Vibrio cortegadensis]|uniref:GNAT family N-acetyltransferase n=1 Tax=Vibrio cortegadensis TaxID=1328770 RepID=UPI0021C25DE1|nr:GNAT family N-acetyltransferase [Vibrio cortegadensis]MDN3695999.1 GNAT family N-acetyltransferase [Vibrio cortegadensis]